MCQKSTELEKWRSEEVLKMICSYGLALVKLMTLNTWIFQVIISRILISEFCFVQKYKYDSEAGIVNFKNALSEKHF